MKYFNFVIAGFVLFAAAAYASDPVVINEIMYHPLQPASGPEPIGEEFIELYNRSGGSVNMNGWRFSKGITFTLTNVSIPPGGYLVVAADTNAFRAKYPTVTNVVGGWSGTLANNGETIELKDAQNNTADQVSYATEGDWAQRQRGADDLGRRGWTWLNLADGFGKSFERRNFNVLVDSGQNWRTSAGDGGTPGRVNSVLTNDLPPLILDLAHSPAVPKSSDTVAITARLIDESAVTSATLFYRIDANPQTNPFQSQQMFDDGAHGDGVAGDGIFGAIIPTQANNTVVEFYVQAVDAGARANTWPAAVIAAADSTGPTGQVANALYQVDDNAVNALGGVASKQPVYKLIMTEAERAELAGIPCSGAQESNAEMNGTFLTMDASETLIRYNCGFRNRGNGTRCASPPNYRVDIPTDRLWKGVRHLNSNTRYTYAQHFGAVLNQKAGVPGANSRAVQLRVNNANLAQSGAPMYGSYAVNEELSSEWANRAFPFDSEGNVYRVLRNIAPPDFLWRGSNAVSYQNTYFKVSNSSVDDWTDLITLHRIFATNDLFTTENVRQVLNVEQWMLYLAVMAMENSQETSPNRGFNDDYAMYRGVEDPQFKLLYYDSDTIIGEGDTAGSTTGTIFGATANNGIGPTFNRFMRWPDFEPVYYATLQRLIDTTFSAPQFNSLIDETLGPYVPANVISRMKTWMDGRRAYVQSVINGLVPPATNNPIATISGEPRSPTPFTAATLTIGGSNITHYQWKLNNSAFSAETPVASPIQLSGLANGSTNTLFIIGRNAAGIYQSASNATVSKTWVVNTAIPRVRLNEVLARNDSAVNHNGGFPDIVELYNEGATTVDLSGMRLTDDSADPNKFVFPTNTTLAAGSYLVVYGGNSDGTGIHLGFNLDQDGDAIYLLDKVSAGGARLDSVVFGLQLSDKSIGRFGASGEWVLTQPSFGAPNTAQARGSASGLKINEWLAVPAAPPFAEDFVELYNPSAQPVAIGGLHFTDEPIGAPKLHRIPDLSFIAAGDHAVFIADGDENAGNTHLSFSLASEQGSIGLTAGDGSLIDCVAYGPQQSGVAQGRCPDGDYKIAFLTLPTPGAANVCPVPPPGPITINLVAISNSWTFNQSGADLGTAWRTVGYNDSDWETGPAILGLEPDPLPEPLRTQFTNITGKITFYFRTKFFVSSNSFAPLSGLQMTHIIDDGAVFYLNGQEAGRYNMPSGTITNGTRAGPSSVGNAVYVGPATFPMTNLFVGTNLLAVEVHQVAPYPTSSDVDFGMTLDALIVTNSASAAGLVINEVLASNATVKEPDGSTPDWVEIYNPSTNAVNVGDMRLSDSISTQRWAFPTPTILPAQSHLLVYFNDNLPASATNTGFGLKASEGGVYLFAKPADGGALVDFVTYGLQTADFSIARAPSGSTNWTLSIPTPRGANLAATLGSASNLKINEWMPVPASGDDWFELFNPGLQPVALGGLWLSDNLSSSTTRMQHRIAPLSFIGSVTNGYIQFLADNNTAAGADHVNFKLANTTEAIGISTASGVLIDGVSYTNVPSDVSEGRLPDGGTNIVRFPTSSSPGEANYLPLTNIVISELLSHTDLPLEDAIELQNISGAPVNIIGWWLSDSKDNLRKYFITNTTIAPGGFKAFYEYQFNDPAVPNSAFSFSSAKGDQCYLSSGTPDGALTGYRATVKFDASENGVSFGRYVTSDGRAEFVSMPALSFGTAITKDSPTNQITVFRTGTGAANPYPKVGPVVISEIMYHPPDIGTNDNVRDEFIELKNITGATVPLYDPAYPTNGWHLRGGVDFDFNSTHSIPAGGYLLVVSFDPVNDGASRAAFQSTYGSNSILVGPYQGKLDNGGESVRLEEPDVPQQPPSPDAGFVPYVLVERVVYSDTAPWPPAADGSGWSLQRVSVTGFGNDPTNWIAAAPTPGPSGITDTDGDGMDDNWERTYFGNLARDGSGDFDGDGLTDRQEYLAGTDPTSASSALRLSAMLNAGALELRFSAIAGKTYTVLYTDALSGASNWQKLADVSAQTSNTVMVIRDNSYTRGIVQRFYRTVTPGKP